MNYYKKIKINKDGFTLVELLLYISLASFILLSISAVLSLMLSSRIKSQAISEVYDQGASVMQIITQQVRNADKIISPATSTSAVSFSLAFASSTINPTVFDLSGGVIRIKEGSGAVIALTSPRVVASGISFDNLSNVGTPGIIRIKFTLSHANSSGRNEYDYTKTFYGSASIKY